MPELMISQTPTPPPSGAGNAHPLSRNDGVSRSGEPAKAGAENGAESPFAAVLKSKMDKEADTADVPGDSSSSAAATQSNPENIANNIDLSGFLPLLRGNPTAAGGVAGAPGTDVESLDAKPAGAELIELEPTAEQAPAQILAALPSARAEIADTGFRKQNAEAPEDSFAAVSPAKSPGTEKLSGKLTPEAAINADLGKQHVGSNASDLAGNDFHALLERAAVTTVTATGSSNNISPADSGLRVGTPLGQAGWHEEMGQKLTWMVGNNRQQADIVLTPPQLGRVEVSLTMNGDQATAIFTSSNPAVREALESSLHRLREVLADAGVSLGQTQVGSESPNQSSRRNEPDFGIDEGLRYASAIPLAGAQAVTGTSNGRGMIDIFA